MKHYGDPCLHCGTPHDDTLFRHALQRLSELSVEHEKAGNVDAFRAAEMACGLLRSSNVIVQRNLAGERVN